MDNWKTDIRELSSQNYSDSLTLRCGQHFRERTRLGFLFLAEGRLLMAADHPDQEEAVSSPRLELYDTSSADPGKIRCVFTLPKRPRGRTSIEIYGSNSYRYHPSTFYTRPEDRILTIFVEDRGPRSRQYPSHLIVVFISTLLHLAQSRDLVEWEEWKKYACVEDNQEAEGPFYHGAFISGSSIINFSPTPPKQPGMRTLELVTFRPSIIEKSFHTSGDASDDSRSAEPGRLIGRKTFLDVRVDGDHDDTEVMMTEDNIILMTVGNFPDDGLPMLTPQFSGESRTPNGFRNDHLDFLTISLSLIACVPPIEIALRNRDTA